jgi:hypothetical protein
VLALALGHDSARDVVDHVSLLADALAVAALHQQSWTSAPYSCERRSGGAGVPAATVLWIFMAASSLL